MSSPPDRPRPRWIRYSVRALLVVMSLCAVGFGWLAMRVRDARQEEDALRRLLAGHGQANFNVSCANPFRTHAESQMLAFFEGGPPWMTRLLGADICRTVVALQVYAPGNSFAYGADEQGNLSIQRTYVAGLHDEDAPLLARFRRLRDLQLEGHPITDRGAVFLGDLHTLEDLNLSATAITDEALPHLAKLRELRRLDLSRTDITDAALEHLAGLPRLEELRLGATNIAPDTIARFKSQRPNCVVDRP